MLEWTSRFLSGGCYGGRKWERLLCHVCSSSGDVVGTGYFSRSKYRQQVRKGRMSNPFVLFLRILIRPASVMRSRPYTNHRWAPKTPSSQQLQQQRVSLAIQDFKLLEFDEDYDYNLPPPPEEEGGPVDVEISLNLRNIFEAS